MASPGGGIEGAFTAEDPGPRLEKFEKSPSLLFIRFGVPIRYHYDEDIPYIFVSNK